MTSDTSPGRAIDVRLVPAAVAAWMAAWWVTGGTDAEAALTASAVSGRPGGMAVVGGWLALAVGFGVIAVVGLRGRRGSGLDRPRATGPSAQGPPGWGLVFQALLAAACALAVVAGGAIHAARSAVLDDLVRGGFTAELTGTVAGEPEPVSWGGPAGAGSASSGVPEWFLLDVDAVRARGVASVAHGRVRVTSSSADQVRFGARVTVRGPLRAPREGSTENGELPAEALTVQRSPPAVLRLLDRHRDALLDVTDDLSPQARGLVPGAAIGDTTRLPEELEEAMRTSGLSHITAVSGGHFAIVVALLTGLAGTLGAPRWVRAALVGTAGVAFVALVRPEPSVLRAAVMAAFALAGMVLGRPAQSVAALAGTVIGLLVVDPTLSRSFGFALSAAATAGLVLLVPPLVARIAPWTGTPFAFALSVPLAAQLACAPVLILLDPSVSLVAVPANLLASPAVVPATVLGLVATILAPWAPDLAGVVGWLASGATWWIAAVATFFATLPAASVPWLGGLAGAVVLGLLTGTALWAVLRRGPSSGWPLTWRAAARSGIREALAVRRRRSARARLIVPAAVVTVCLLVVAVAMPRIVGIGRTPSDWQVVACDVGQGDTTLLRSGPSSAVVIDVGPAGSAAGRCLDDLGVTTVDLLVLSHFHADHVGGLGPVLEGRVVSGALVSPVDDPSAAAAITRTALADAGVLLRDARAGDHGTAGSVAWEVLQSGAGAGEDAANDGSVVIAARTRDLEVLLLGDLETAGQTALVEVLHARAARGGTHSEFDVVKVAHHGSAEQSAELARLTSPLVALVSAGRHNDYGHPTDRALDLYAGVGAAVVRTDRCGSAALVARDGELGVSGC